MTTEITGYSAQEVAEIVEIEGLGYAIQSYTNADSIADEDIAEQWRIASNAMDEIERILRERTDYL